MERGNLKTQRPRRIVHKVSATHEVLSSAHIRAVAPEHVNRALADARPTPFDDFRKQRFEWLRSKLPVLVHPIEVFYSSTITSHGIDTANAILSGSLLGSAVLEGVIETTDIDIEACQHNIRTWNLTAIPLSYDGTDFGPALLDRLYGSETSAALQAINNSVARTACSATLAVTLAPQPH